MDLFEKILLMVIKSVQKRILSEPLNRASVRSLSHHLVMAMTQLSAKEGKNFLEGKNSDLRSQGLSSGSLIF